MAQGKISRNPKRLNRASKDKLAPLYQKIEELENKQSDIRNFIEEVEQKNEDVVTQMNYADSSFREAMQVLTDLVDKSKSDLSEMILRTLYNPNQATGSGGEGGGGIIEETRFIKDKVLSSLAYNFVDNGINKMLAGTINNGLAIGPDLGYDSEFTFLNPNNNTFPSYKINSIRGINTSTAYICTNVGFVEFNIISKNYKLRDTSHGIPEKEVYDCIEIRDSEDSYNGFLISTKNALSISISGERWNVACRIDDSINCIMKQKNSQAKYAWVLIGTTNGIYFFDINEYIKTNEIVCIKLEKLSLAISSYNINSLLYDGDNDELYICTNSGVSVVKNIKKYIDARVFDNPPQDIQNYTSKNGLAGTQCYDAYIVEDIKYFATNNGISKTKNMIDYTTITKKIYNADGDVINEGKLNAFVCNKFIRRGTYEFSVIHPVGYTENLTVSQ